MAETVEAKASRGPIGASLDRIEAAVEGGDRDLRALGFWRLVAEIKRDDLLIVEHADQVGRIDAAAFRAWGGLHVSVWVAEGVLLLATVVGVAAAIVAFAIDSDVWKGLLLLAAGGAWTVSVHVPAHLLVGWMASIRFSGAYLGGPAPPWPGVKTDYATYLRAEPALRAWFHASGAIASKVAPLVAAALAMVAGAPAWSWGVLLGITALGVATDVVISRKSSDWKKFARERRVARDRAATTAPREPEPLVLSN